MDIDLQLIKLVRQRPILYKTSFDTNNNSQRVAWKEISSLIKKEDSWARTRWYSIVEKFIKELRISDSVKRKSKYKYFNDLSFLKKHIEWKVLSEKSTENQHEVCNDSMEFIITDEQLDEIDDSTDSDDNIFEELKEENHDEVEQEAEETIEETQKNSCSLIENECYDENYKNTLEVFELENTVREEMPQEEFVENSNATYGDRELSDKENQMTEEYNDILSNQDLDIGFINIDIDPNCTDFDANSEITKTDASFNILQNIGNSQLSSSDSESNVVYAEMGGNIKDLPRSEDTIFAELVGVMLTKMDSNKKKKAKREIMNILLS